ncbi:unnamed protein product [Rangifer tarandus platyrhynchus]|uniref:Uncharacterized protein n=1 Tax=Rangifer tarandus platyrhynchus TaxID=3082113 RepID=A0AC59YFC1_RANTA
MLPLYSGTQNGASLQAGSRQGPLQKVEIWERNGRPLGAGDGAQVWARVRDPWCRVSFERSITLRGHAFGDLTSKAVDHQNTEQSIGGERVKIFGIKRTAHPDLANSKNVSVRSVQGSPSVVPCLSRVNR